MYLQNPFRFSDASGCDKDIVNLIQKYPMYGFMILIVLLITHPSLSVNTFITDNGRVWMAQRSWW